VEVGGDIAGYFGRRCVPSVRATPARPSRTPQPAATDLAGFAQAFELLPALRIVEQRRITFERLAHDRCDARGPYCT